MKLHSIFLIILLALSIDVFASNERLNALLSEFELLQVKHRADFELNQKNLSDIQDLCLRGSVALRSSSINERDKQWVEDLPDIIAILTRVAYKSYKALNDNHQAKKSDILKEMKLVQAEKKSDLKQELGLIKEELEHLFSKCNRSAHAHTAKGKALLDETKMFVQRKIQREQYIKEVTWITELLLASDYVEFEDKCWIIHGGMLFFKKQAAIEKEINNYKVDLSRRLQAGYMEVLSSKEEDKRKLEEMSSRVKVLLEKH